MSAVDYFGGGTVGSISEGMLSSVFVPAAGVGKFRGHLLLIPTGEAGRDRLIASQALGRAPKDRLKGLSGSSP